MTGKFKYTYGFVSFLSVVIFFGCSRPTEKEIISVVNPRCEMLVNPEALDAPMPRLSWEIESPQRNIKQTAYQILVASDPERLANDEGDIWNSGKVDTDQSVQVPYAGQALKSRMRCWWKVKVWSRKGESPWSEPARWQMGLLGYKDWKGRWIGFDRAFPWDRIEPYSRLSARYFRKEFETDPGKTIQHAKVYIIGLGLYELYVNGNKTGTQVLSPSPTDYTRAVFYNAYDVTGSIEPGRNAVGVVLGNGRYFTMRQHYKPYKIKDFGFPKLLFNLVIEYTGGSVTVIASDDSWKGTADGPVRSNNEYDGEEYDARKEMPGWNRAGFDDGHWLKTAYAAEPGGFYKAQMNPNMQVMDTLYPKSITRMGSDRYLLDMGQNMAGWLKMKVKGQRGQRVSLRFAESLGENGELFTGNLRSARATDIYTLKGGEGETWRPAFVYHGFRYAEISGYPGTPELSDFTGEVVYDEMNITGSVETSDTLLNRIYGNAFESIRGNYKGMPVDCPQRDERQPWLGDRATCALGESYVFDNAGFYAKWLDDIKLAQKDDGCLPDMAPPYYNYYSDNMTWPGTYILVAQMLYRQYGDKRSIVEHYSHMKKWLGYMKDRYMDDHIITKDSYGDWCAPPNTIAEGRDLSANIKKPSKLISTAYYYHYLGIMQEFAEITGNTADIKSFSGLSDSIRQAFNRKFLQADTVYHETSILTDNLLPLYFGMVPAAMRDKVFQKIIDIIVQDNEGHLSTGMIGTQWLMRSLAENGRPDIAYQLAVNTTYPSWGYMVENGATTIWELWNGNTAAPGMNSQNHVMMLGDLIVWYYENLAGIKPDPGHPGFKKILLQPEFTEGLEFVKGTYRSVHGMIKSHWARKESNIEWQITIPANTTAEVRIPVTTAKEVTESGKVLSEVYGINRIKKSGAYLYLELGSGHYHFIF